MADATRLKQRASFLLDQTTQEIQKIESTRDLSSKRHVESMLAEGTNLFRDLERVDISYARDFKQKIDGLRQRLENASRLPTYGAWNNGFDPDADRLGQQQRDLLLRGHASLVRTDDALRVSRQTAHETEQLGNEIMSDLTSQRESLLRTQDKLNEGNENLKAGSKILRLMYGRVVMNKVLLITIILIELVILAGVVYWKFFSKK